MAVTVGHTRILIMILDIYEVTKFDINRVCCELMTHPLVMNTEILAYNYIHHS